MTAHHANGSDVSGRADGAGSFADQLQAHTADLHCQAERSGVIRDILRGRATEHGYAVYLRNLLCAYQSLEEQLEKHRESDLLQPFARPEVYRAEAMAADLNRLCGYRWSGELDLLPAAERYRDRIETAGGGDGTRLMAHAYVRYLGDLNGGQILRRLLQRSLGLSESDLSFYDFPDIRNLDDFRREYRAGFDVVAKDDALAQAVLDEAALAFTLNIELSEAVQRFANDTNRVQTPHSELRII